MANQLGNEASDSSITAVSPEVTSQRSLYVPPAASSSTSGARCLPYGAAKDQLSVQSQQTQPDLLLGWKNIQKESRYSFTAPSPERIFAHISTQEDVVVTDQAKSPASVATSWTSIGVDVPHILATSSVPAAVSDVSGTASERHVRTQPEIETEATILSNEKMAAIFDDLGAKFRFQNDAKRNAAEYLGVLLHSRECRMTKVSALDSLHE
ncbi:hypothetical protein DFJ73DRAFT_792235 [Zopfochytrium polystomum]|nr:hypothetical protein DFJ73DRAFT_792235 [Zopfochytrium polystomum]